MLMFLGRTCLGFCLELFNCSDQESIDREAFYLTTGEMAPFKSIEEVYRLSPDRRHFFVNELSDLYRRQKEAMDESRRG